MARLQRCLSTMTEIWRSIPNYEDAYEVSTYGRVRSLARRCKGSNQPSRAVREKILKPHPWSGYPAVTLFRDGHRKRYKTAALVALAFIGERPYGLELCHNDSDRQNSRLENLRYDTRSGNFADKIQNGTRYWKAGRVTAALLTEDQVREIKRSAKIESGLSMARRFGVSQATISHIIVGRNWTHVI